MQITPLSHSPPHKKHLKLHVQPIQLPDTIALNRTLGNSDPEIPGTKIIKTERNAGLKQTKKFHIKNALQNPHFRQHTNHNKNQESDGLSIILDNKQSVFDKMNAKQLILDLKKKQEEQQALIRYQEFKISRLQQELQSQRTYCQNLLEKFHSIDQKGFLNSHTKIVKQTQEASKETTKILQENELQLIKQFTNQINSLKQQYVDFSKFVKETLLQMNQLIINSKEQITNNIQVSQIEQRNQIQALENFINMQNSFQQINYNKIFLKCEIATQELVMSETQKEIYYQKCIQLLS